MKNKQTTAEINKRLNHYLPKRRHPVGAGSKICLVIDGMNMVYAAYYSYSRLSFKGASTSIVFGVPQMLKSIMGRYKPEKIIVCWDGDKHPKRLEICPEYKAHREKNRKPEERKKFLKQVKKLRVLLYRMGIQQAYDRKVEGDDMVYFITQEVVKTHRVIIVSADKDFHQLINHDISIYNPRTNLPYSTFAFKGDHFVEVAQFVDYLCLVGDDSDNIKGYIGIGPARASTFFEKFYRIKDFLNNKKAEYPGMADKDQVEKVYRRNRTLIDLPYFCHKYYPEDYKPRYYKLKQFPQWDEVLYRKMCIKYNLRTMLTTQFIDTFKNL